MLCRKLTLKAIVVLLSIATIKDNPVQAATFTFYSPGIYEFGLNYFTGKDNNTNGSIELGELSNFYADLRQYWGQDAKYNLSDVRNFNYPLGTNSLSYLIGDNNPKPELYGFGGLVAEISEPDKTVVPEPSIATGLFVLVLGSTMIKIYQRKSNNQ
jgi:hypothetical protein